MNKKQFFYSLTILKDFNIFFNYKEKIFKFIFKLNLVFEYFSSTNLDYYLKKLPEKKMLEIDAKNIFRQLIEAINYSHNNFIIHRDIKPENILINEKNKEIKVIDFGFSNLNENKKMLNFYCGTPSYMAPELILKKEHFGPPLDIWALGVLLYQILKGKCPFQGKLIIFFKILFFFK